MNSNEDFLQGFKRRFFNIQTNTSISDPNENLFSARVEKIELDFYAHHKTMIRTYNTRGIKACIKNSIYDKASLSI